MTDPMDELDVMDANEIRDAQGWSNDTMLDLAHQFIFDSGRGEAYAEFLRGVASQENEK